ncbi:MupG family TIM beta-alpha barrel fold protein, partial [uncultured Dubosiella sp.]|uniref:MupG family TIM beta-alpha barrel fold protein n=1 Tax=uncultured Dubosiella sp. TaxID=1937011 RepID=UPI00266F2789
MKLGLSVYPEQETLEQIEAYLTLGAKHGFDTIFTSIFSVDGTRKEIVDYFKKLTDIAHGLGYVSLRVIWYAKVIKSSHWA